MDIKQTTCPFCRNGCRLGVSFDGYQYRVEYLNSLEPNYGRLCPRGNSANIVLDHPKRLAYPLFDGKEIEWQRAFSLIKEWHDEVKPDEIAVVYSRGLTEEEIGVVYGLAAGLGTNNLVCGYLESDNAFFYKLEGGKPATLDDIKSARTILLVGDVFSTSPVAAKGILESRYAERQSRLLVIDSIKSQQAGFAQLFIQPKVGTEHLVVAAIAAMLDQKLKVDIEGVAEFCGVPKAQLEEAAKILKAGNKGFVGCAATSGKIAEPFWHSTLAQLVALKANMPFAGFGEAVLPEGKMSFGSFREAVTQGKIKFVLWFGGLYPYSYPEVFSEMHQVEFRVATSIFRSAKPLPGLVLPVPSELEKEGEGESLWGKVNRQAVAKPLSGTKPVREIVTRLGIMKTPEKISWSEQVKLDFLLAKTEEVLKERLSQNTAGSDNGWLLLGERRAIGMAGFFDDEEEVVINPADARKLNVKPGDFVKVKSRTGERCLRVQVASVVPSGVVSIGFNRHENRALFPVEIDADSNGAKIPPTKVEICQA